jgi:hypothetical protein
MCIIHLCALFYSTELRKLKESFAHKAPVAFNCKLRFNGSISTATPYTESRLARLVRNKRAGFPVVEHIVICGL